MLRWIERLEPKGVSNVIELIEPAPEGFNVSREEWSRTPEVLRAEIIRMHTELAEGVEITKDRAAGRRSRRPGGFWEMHCCERDGQLERAAELRELLAPEIALRAGMADLDEYHAMAISHGKTLAQVIGEYVAVERRLANDPVAEIERIAATMGFDLEGWALKQLADDAVA